jgi:hypothetical protein
VLILANGQRIVTVSDGRSAQVPARVRERAFGPYALAAVALIGHDSDTYAATAGPMIAAATGHVPEEFTEGLEINDRTHLWEAVRA